MPRSRVAEMARAEADDAEREQPDKPDKPLEPGAPDQPPTETPADPDVSWTDDQPPEGEDPDSAEAFARHLDAIMARLERDLAALFGAEPPLAPSPMDGVLGFVVPGAATYQPNEKYRACRTCNGMGDVLTGSVKEGNRLQPCPRCAGRGFLERLSETPPPATPGYAFQTSSENATAGAGTVQLAPAPAPVASADDDAGYGVPSWAGDPSIRPAG